MGEGKDIFLEIKREKEIMITGMITGEWYSKIISYSHVGIKLLFINNSMGSCRSNVLKLPAIE